MLVDPNNEVSIFTDHAALKYILKPESAKNKNYSERLTRWALTIQQVNSKVFNISSTQNAMADILTRFGYSEDDIDFLQNNGETLEQQREQEIDDQESGTSEKYNVPECVEGQHAWIEKELETNEIIEYIEKECEKKTFFIREPEMEISNQLLDERISMMSEDHSNIDGLQLEWEEIIMEPDDEDYMSLVNDVLEMKLFSKDEGGRMLEALKIENEKEQEQDPLNKPTHDKNNQNEK